MKLVVGLGNPGKQYVRTRHNIGFVVLDALQERLNKECDMNAWSLSKKFNAEVCGCTLGGSAKIVLGKPATFMNASGQAVQLLAQFYDCTKEDIIVAHDDKDLPLGEIKIQSGRGDAGHNGVKSIIEHLGTKDFMRVRLGVASGNPRKMKDTSAFVLGKFSILERKKMEAMVKDAVEMIVKELE